MLDESDVQRVAEAVRKALEMPVILRMRTDMPHEEVDRIARAFAKHTTGKARVMLLSPELEPVFDSKVGVLTEEDLAAVAAHRFDLDHALSECDPECHYCKGTGRIGLDDAAVPQDGTLMVVGWISANCHCVNGRWRDTGAPFKWPKACRKGFKLVGMGKPCGRCYHEKGEHADE